MAEESILIRCPGCGKANAVALAVGQQIQCRLCQTYFFAPILTDGQPPSILSPPVGQSDPLIPPVTAFASGAPTVPIPTPVFATGPRPTSNLAATRSWRTEEVVPPEGAVVENVTAPTAVNPISSAAGVAPAAAEPELEESAAGWFWPTLSVIAALIIASSTLLLGVHLFRKWNAPATETAASVVSSAPTEPGTKSKPAATGPIRWSNAERNAQRLGRLELKVLRVKFGAILAKDLNNEVITTDDKSLLAVNVSVHNRSDEPCVFHSWYAGGCTSADGQELLPELVDDQGNTYSLLRFDDVSSIEGQRLAEEIEPRQVVHDTVVFLIPPDRVRSQLQYFHLTLPAHAIGVEDFFRFEIPVSMIQGFASAEPSQ